MSATTIDATAQASASATQDPKTVMKRFAQPMTEAFGGMWGLGRWIWHFDLGAIVLVSEQTARFAKAAVKRGEEVEPALIKPFRKAGDSVSEVIGEVGTRLKGVAKPKSTSLHSRSQSGHNRRARAARTAPIKAH